MSFAKVLFSLIFVLLILSKEALGINVILKKEEIEDAIKNGEDHGEDVFKSPILKNACINYWPRQGGILVRSKFVDIMVSAAMWFNEGQKVSYKEIKEINYSPYFRVVMRTKDDVFILLKQGQKIIEPANINYEDPCCELYKFHGGDKAKHEFVTSSFLYNQLGPNAKTIIIVKGPFREKGYNVDLSMIK
ncbi:MAG: hypothetical protein ACYSTS_13885 [Planctomycetota bacterium]|jgi:hypothetical protein